MTMTAFPQVIPTFLTHICLHKSQPPCAADFLPLHPIPQIKKPAPQKWTDSCMASQVITGGIRIWIHSWLQSQHTFNCTVWTTLPPPPSSLAISLRTLPVIWERISQSRVFCANLYVTKVQGFKMFWCLNLKTCTFFFKVGSSEAALATRREIKQIPTLSGEWCKKNREENLPCNWSWLEVSKTHQDASNKEEMGRASGSHSRW